MIRLGRGFELATGLGPDSMDAYQARNPMASHLYAFGSQRRMNTGAAVGLATLGMRYSY